MFRDFYFSLCEPLLALLSYFVDHLLLVSLIPLTLFLEFFECLVMGLRIYSYWDEDC